MYSVGSRVFREGLGARARERERDCALKEKVGLERCLIETMLFQYRGEGRVILSNAREAPGLLTKETGDERAWTNSLEISLHRSIQHGNLQTPPRCSILHQENLEKVLSSFS